MVFKRLTDAIQNRTDDQYVESLDRTLRSCNIPVNSQTRREAISLAAMSGLTPKQRNELVARIERYEARHRR